MLGLIVLSFLLFPGASQAFDSSVAMGEIPHCSDVEPSPNAKSMIRTLTKIEPLVSSIKFCPTFAPDLHVALSVVMLDTTSQTPQRHILYNKNMFEREFLEVKPKVVVPSPAALFVMFHEIEDVRKVDLKSPDQNVEKETRSDNVAAERLKTLGVTARMLASSPLGQEIPSDRLIKVQDLLGTHKDENNLESCRQCATGYACAYEAGLLQMSRGNATQDQACIKRACELGFKELCPHVIDRS